MRPLLKSVILCGCILGVLSVETSSADLRFGPSQADINGSIKYSVIGRYKAVFSGFEGVIALDPLTKMINSVRLKIEAKTISSDCSWCDDIVRSPQLLDVGRYPKISFDSVSISKDEDIYRVRGILDLHGVKKEMTFPFQVSALPSADGQKTEMYIQGRWIIARKDFGITWNKFLDQGGVLVGNHITIDWKIKVVL